MRNEDIRNDPLLTVSNFGDFESVTDPGKIFLTEMISQSYQKFVELQHLLDQIKTYPLDTEVYMEANAARTILVKLDQIIYKAKAFALDAKIKHHQALIDDLHKDMQALSKERNGL